MARSVYGKVLIGLVVFGTIWLLIVHSIVPRQQPIEPDSREIISDEPTRGNKLPLICNKISLVYTWVNGSDPEHIAARTERSGTNQFSQPGNNRFRDLGGLMYSLRSVEKYGKWIKDIFIVASDGQVPGWLNTKHPHIHVVPHSQIFPTKSDLPTFSSNAIESSFHRLPPEVGDCFIYLNDDMFFGNDVYPSDFWNKEQGQILFKSAWTAPPPQTRMNNIWHRSIGFSNSLLDRLWDEKGTRHYASHGPYFFSMKVLKHMYNSFPVEFNATTARPFRHEKDVSMPFLYHNFALHYYNTFVADKTINSYLKIVDDARKMQNDFNKIKEKHPKTVCMNDALSLDPPDDVLQVMHQFFHDLFPNKSEYELYEDPFM